MNLSASDLTFFSLRRPAALSLERERRAALSRSAFHRLQGARVPPRVFRDHQDRERAETSRGPQV